MKKVLFISNKGIIALAVHAISDQICKFIGYANDLYLS